MVIGNRCKTAEDFCIQMWKLAIIFLFLATPSQGEDHFDFDHKNFGILFHHDDDGCTIEEMTVMFKVISTRFRKVYTPGGGIEERFGVWQYGDCPMLAGQAAALVNKAAGALKLQVAMGVDVTLRNRQMEMQNTLEAATYANLIFPGTVTEINLWNYGGKLDRLKALSLLNTTFVTQVKEAGMDIGFHDHNCGELAAMENHILAVLRFSRYLICRVSTAREYDRPLRQAAIILLPEIQYLKEKILEMNDTFIIPKFVTVYEADHPTAKDTATFFGEVNKMSQTEQINVIMGYAFLRYTHIGWFTQVTKEIKDENAFTEWRLTNGTYPPATIDEWEPNSTCYARTPFQRDLFGVVFRPHKIHTRGATDFQGMLDLVATRFSYIMWTQLLPHLHLKDYGPDIAYAACQINKIARKPKLSVILQTDIERGLNNYATSIAAAHNCNSKFQGTVVGISVILPNRNYLALFRKFVAEARSARHAGLHLGVGLNCGADSEDSQELLQGLDFIVCRVVRRNIGRPVIVAGKVYSEFLGLRAYIRSFAPKLEFFGVAHIIHGGSTRDDSNLRKAKLVETWLELHKLINQSNFTVFMDEAFDDADTRYGRNMGWWESGNAAAEKVRVIGIGANCSESNWDTEDELPSHTEVLEGYTETAVIGSITVFLFFCAVMVVYISWRILRRTKISRQHMIEAFFRGGKPLVGDDIGNIPFVAPYDEGYEVKENDLQIDYDTILGTGHYGTVYKAVVTNPHRTHVAVKVSIQALSSTGYKSVLSEIKVMIYVGGHPNVTSMFGACTKNIEQGKVMIITELCERGSLHSILRSARGSDASSGFQYPTYIRWAYEIALGMKHIASKNVVHADLATRNVLIDANNVAKVSDFGLSRHLYEYTNYIKKNQEPLPWRWMSIEALRDLSFSTKSDVWSFGITLWELYTFGSVPYPGMSWTSGFVDQLVDGLRPGKPDAACDKMYGVMERCWNSKPEDRPTFTDIAQDIGDLFRRVREGLYETI